MRTTTRQDWRLDLADAWLAVLLVLILLLSGCATRKVWSDVAEHDGNSIDWSDGKTIAAVAITPVAVVLDVGVMWAVMAALACSGAGGALPGFNLDFDAPAPRDDMERWHASKIR